MEDHTKLAKAQGEGEEKELLGEANPEDGKELLEKMMGISDSIKHVSPSP